MIDNTGTRVTTNDIAIIGMSGRFPGAEDISTFWRNLIAGKETVTTFEGADLVRAGLPAALLQEPNYVPKRGILKDVECFDAGFFSYSPRDAELLDPQQRIFLECAWTAIEDAGYDPMRCSPSIGVFAGSNMNSYLLFHLLQSDEALRQVHSLGLSTEKDFLATRVSYKLNLQGPSVSVQCACSTSLVCVHLACQSLLARECDMALAGGVSVVFPQAGYFYQPGSVFSPDGHCRPFDQRAAGTFGSDGVGVVLLKRLEDALRDRDHIYANILGTSMNNDGSEKASFASPSIKGQIRVVADAIGIAGVQANSIGYVEAHGTGTPLGDPMEIAALAAVFGAKGMTRGSCSVGSLKSNFGHLDQAAGVANLIKTALILKHGLIPPTLHFDTPNPALKLEETPFRVNAALVPWPDNHRPRRASVSSFGFGGTNAHAVLEAEHRRQGDLSSTAWQILPLSARTDAALNAGTDRLAQHIEENQSECLSDTAFVLQIGRSEFARRQFLVARSHQEVQSILLQRDPKQLITGDVAADSLPVYFMFPGQGTQYCGMGGELYAAYSVFRDHVDQACELLRTQLDIDLRQILFPPEDGLVAAQALLAQTRYTQPALFVVEYALARLWMSCGIEPRGFIGHSIGEYVAACIAGVFTLKDALHLVATRAALMQKLSPGSMLSVNASKAQLKEVIGAGVALAAVNGPQLCVLAFEHEHLAAISNELQSRGHTFQKLHTSHAFHSHMMEPMLQDFTRVLARLTLSKPVISFISNVTGDWIDPDEAVKPAYWCRHLRQTVLFGDGIGKLVQGEDCALLEVGPGKTLATLVRQQPAWSTRSMCVSSMRGARDTDAEEKIFLAGLGRLWVRGVSVDWQGLREGKPGRRISLPTYPFERTPYMVPPRRLDKDAEPKSIRPLRQAPDKWTYFPTWSRIPLPVRSMTTTGTWLVLTDDPQLTAGLGQPGEVILATSGTRYREELDHFVVRPESAKDLEQMLQRLAELGRSPEKIVFAWNVQPAGGTAHEELIRARQHVLDSLFALVQALLRSHSDSSPIELLVVTIGAQDVTGSESLSPIAATLAGPCKVITQEHAHLHCRCIDFAAKATTAQRVAHLKVELLSDAPEPSVAYRDNVRFKRAYEQITFSSDETEGLCSLDDVVLITGGLGEVGLAVAEQMASQYQVKLALVGRSVFPEMDEWDEWIENHSQDDEVRRTIVRLRRMSDSGTEIYLATADVADKAAMKQVLDAIRARLGPLKLVYHAAGISGQEMFQGVGRTSPDDLQRHFNAKVYGVQVLDALLRDEAEVKAVILQSSIFGALGGPGCAAACAATLFMDSLCAGKKSLKHGPHWLSIGWDAWLPMDQGNHDPTGLAIKIDEVLPLLERIVTLRDVGHVVVSTSDLEIRISRWSDAKSAQENQSAKQEGRVYDRPHLKCALVAPQSEIEVMLALLWQELLGLREVGVEDDFFELGGHSLLAILILGRIKDTFPVEIEFHDMAENPTIAGLALLLELRLIEKLEHMSEEDTSQLLQTILQPNPLQAVEEANERYLLA